MAARAELAVVGHKISRVTTRSASSVRPTGIIHTARCNTSPAKQWHYQAGADYKARTGKNEVYVAASIR